MTTLSHEALMIAAIAVMRDIDSAEDDLAELDRADPDAATLGDELMRMTRVLGELQDAYQATATGPDGPHPAWNDLRQAAGLE